MSTATLLVLALAASQDPLSSEAGEPQSFALAPWAREVEFPASDEHPVTAALYPAHRGAARDDVADPKGLPVLVLCHQSASNHAEYAPIAPRLADAGFHALALDLRGGGMGYGRVNPTRELWELETGHHGGGPQAALDVEGAYAWLRDAGYTGPVTVWGSSYTAGRLFQVVRDHPEWFRAAVSFSPGHGFARRGDDGEPAWCESARLPVFQTWAPHELDDERRAEFARIGSEVKVLYEQPAGVHGASTLHPDRNPDGHAAILQAVLAFLDEHAR